MIALPYGFRIFGATSEPRRLVNATAAFIGYAACDPRAKVEYEAYLSAFSFGEEIRSREDAWWRLDIKGFNGLASAEYAWFDIDRDADLACALSDTRRLCNALQNRFAVADELLVFFSGSKGFHLGLPTSLWNPEPSNTFNGVMRQFAELIANDASVAIDTAVYDKVRPFRAPNSRHAKTGLHKRRFSIDDLNRLTIGEILDASRQPDPFNVPNSTRHSEQAAADWAAAVERVQRQTDAHAQRRAATNGEARLNRLTLEFIANGAEPGDRHRLLYSAAANLGEFNCPPELAHALLTEAARDSGLAPTDIRRQIDCGLDATSNKGEQLHD